MLDMLDLSNVIYESWWGLDKTGRVFYWNDRVFRIINPCAEQRVLDFLESDLYYFLVDNNYITKTWIANDVVISGCSLILEHEYVFCSRPEDWTFEMKKEVAIFALKIIDISRKYGYCIIDPTVNNFAISCGKIVFVDFGSFYNTITSDTNRYLALSHYLPLKISSQFGHDIGISIFDLLPRELSDNSKIIISILRRIIKKFDFYYHSNSWHITLHLSFFFNIIPMINNTVRSFFPHIGAKNLIKRRVVYKKIREKDIKRLKNPNANMHLDNILPMEDPSIIKCIAWYADLKSISINTVLCIGNFFWGDILLLSSIVNKFVNVLSNDSVYIDKLFKNVISPPPSTYKSYLWKYCPFS